MIWLIGGTSEAKKLAGQLTVPFIMTVAGESSLADLPGINIRHGRLNKEEMQHFVIEEKIGLVLDLSHPYAVEVSSNARMVCAEAQIAYYRYLRPPSRCGSSVIAADDVAEACNILSSFKGTVFFTTGTKNIADFEKVRGKNRYIYRILPGSSSIAICEKHQLSPKDILAATGPFSTEFNLACFKNYRAKMVVSKNSGSAGGTVQKMRACQKLGIRLLLIDRTAENGIADLNKIKEIADDFYAGHRSGSPTGLP